MSFRTTVRASARLAGVSLGIGLSAAAGLAQPTPLPILPPLPEPVAVPSLVLPPPTVKPMVPQFAPAVAPITPVNFPGDTIPPADSPPLPRMAPVAPPVKATTTPAVAPKPASSGTMVASAAPQSSPDALPRMLAEARTAYARVRDYVGHYVRQERVRDRLIPEETCELRVRTSPFSVSVKVTGPREFANRETAYLATRYSGSKVRFKETNKLAYATLPLDDPKVLADTRHVVTDVGLAAVLDRVEAAVRVEKRAGNPVQVLVSDYTFAGRACRRYEVFADRPHAHRYAHRHVLFIDKETRLPVRYEAYDQPTAGGPATGELIEAQSFVGLKFNTGLGEVAFER